MTDEEKPTIELTNEFEQGNCQPITIAGLCALLKQTDKQKKSDQENSIFKETKEYAYKFNKYGMSDDLTKKVIKLQKIIPDNLITSIETVQLIDILPGNCEEAFSLIPSLKDKLSNDQLENYLQELNKESE